MTMNRIINNADLVVEDMLKGWLVAHADTVVATDNSRVVKRARAPEALDEVRAEWPQDCTVR